MLSNLGALLERMQPSAENATTSEIPSLPPNRMLLSPINKAGDANEDRRPSDGTEISEEAMVA